MSKRRITPTLVSSEYVFERFANVFDADTLDFLQRTYEHREQHLNVQLEHADRVPQRINSEQGCVRYRQGRVDALLTSSALAPLPPNIVRTIVGMMDASRPSRVSFDVRGLFVPGAAPAQDEHQDYAGGSGRARYVTVLVALDDVQESGGPTEFRVAADRYGLLSQANVNGPGFEAPLLRKNEALAFDGRILHLGGAATQRRAPVIYYVIKHESLIDVNVE